MWGSCDAPTAPTLGPQFMIQSFRRHKLQPGPAILAPKPEAIGFAFGPHAPRTNNTSDDFAMGASPHPSCLSFPTCTLVTSQSALRERGWVIKPDEPCDDL